MINSIIKNSHHDSSTSYVFPPHGYNVDVIANSATSLTFIELSQDNRLVSSVISTSQFIIILAHAPTQSWFFLLKYWQMVDSLWIGVSILCKRSWVIGQNYTHCCSTSQMYASCSCSLSPKLSTQLQNVKIRFYLRSSDRAWSRKC